MHPIKSHLKNTHWRPFSQQIATKSAPNLFSGQPLTVLINRIKTNPRIHRFPVRTHKQRECVCTHIYIRTQRDIITRAKHRVGTRVLSAGTPAGNPVKHAPRPDGMNYGQCSTPDTPFTDHSGEPLATGSLHLSSFLSAVVTLCLDNRSLLKRCLLVYLFVWCLKVATKSSPKQKT